MSIPSIGNYTCANLAETKLRAEQIFNAELRNQEYVADVDIAKFIKGSQTAKLELLEQPDKDREVKIWWMDDCDSTDPEDINADDCDLSGEELGAVCASYALDISFEKGFSVTEKKFRTLEATKEEQIAKSLAKKMKIMDEFWTKKLIAAINAAAGVNAYPSPYTATGNHTDIPAAAWNPDLFGYLMQVLKMNKIPNARFVSGSLLYQYMWKVGMETSNPTGAAEARKFSTLGDPVFDLMHMDTVLGEKAAFLVNPNALAWASKTYWPSEGREIATPKGKQIRSNIESFNIPGLYYDLIYEQTCENNDIKETWALQTYGGIFQNPTGCNTDRTGILKFSCV